MIGGAEVKRHKRQPDDASGVHGETWADDGGGKKRFSWKKGKDEQARMGSNHNIGKICMCMYG